MKYFILAAFLAVAAAGTIPYGTHSHAEQPKNVHYEPQYPVITQQEDVRNLDGSSKFSYESSDKIMRQESQYQKQIGSATGTAAQGSSSYFAPDGQKIELSWTADENGYRPVGAHLPVAPPVPADIAAMLPSLPKLSFEQLYGRPAVAASQSAFVAPKYEAPKYDAPKYDAPRQMYADVPVHTAPHFVAPEVEMPTYEVPAVPVAPVARIVPDYVPKMQTPKYHAPRYASAPAAVAPAAPSKSTNIRSY